MANLTITQLFGINNTNYLPKRKVEWIAIHYTAGTTSKAGSALSLATAYKENRISTSSDFTVDDTTVVQYNEDIVNRCTWGVGGNKYPSMSTSLGGQYYGKCTNANCINIEVCSNKKDRTSLLATDKDWYFTDAEIELTVKLVKFLMKKFNINIDHVIMHHQVTGKLCPAHWTQNEAQLSQWYDFLNKVKKCAVPSVSYVNKNVANTSTTTTNNNNTTATKSYPKVPFVVAVIVSDLNYRSQPSMLGAVKGQTGKGKFTITQLSGDWGKLASGAGWIYLGNDKYTTIPTAASGTPATAPTKTIVSPYKGKFRVSQEYKGTAHQGLDLVGVDSKNLYATVDGKVEIASNADPNGFGLYVRILANNGWRYYYGHMSKVNVKVGDIVKTGDLIGVEGSTGRSTGSHCHYEVRQTMSKDSFANINTISGIPNAIGTYTDNTKKREPAPTTSAPVVSTSTKELYKVKITCDVLNVRSGPGLNYPVVATTKKGTTLTIMQEQNGFGFLKSKAGWIRISSDYVKKL